MLPWARPETEMVDDLGIEPKTFGLQDRRSPIELLARVLPHYGVTTWGDHPP